MRFIRGAVIASWKLYPIPRLDDVKYRRPRQSLNGLMGPNNFHSRQYCFVVVLFVPLLYSYTNVCWQWFVSPRPAGVWIVTRPAGGGGGKGPPLRSPKLLDRFPNFKRHSIAMYVNYPYKAKHLTRRSLMTSQVRSKSEFSTFRAWWYRRVKFRC